MDLPLADIHLKYVECRCQECDVLITKRPYYCEAAFSICDNCLPQEQDDE